jgi:hypothetical protein
VRRGSSTFISFSFTSHTKTKPALTDNGQQIK